MAGFFAAAANTPISTLVMVSEMTGSYLLLLPSLWVCSISYLLGRRWSLYQNQVPTPFQSPAHRKQFFVDLLEDVQVGEVLSDTELRTIPETASLDDVFAAFTACNSEFLPVVDGQGLLLGLISLRILRQLLDEKDAGPALIARDIAMPPHALLHTADKVNVALQQFVSLDVAELPVVHADDDRRIVAMLARGDLMRAYNTRRREHLQAKAALLA
jgi:CIC family chloride channel protein